MKKNLYYRTVFKRTNAMKETILAFFLALCSWPRLLLEVFLRKNMGERYFSFSTGIVMAILLALLPLVYNEVSSQFFGGGDTVLFLLRFTSWYIFLAGFLYMCFQRQEEINRLPSVFDFGRFSLAAGVINPQFREFEIGGKKPDVRLIETVVEPGVCAFIGFSLMLVGQPIGIVIFISSIFYSFSYLGAYRQGDHFIMDKIDEMICNEELVKAFVEGRDASETRGVAIYGRKPADPETRRKLIDTFIQDEPVEAF